MAKLSKKENNEEEFGEDEELEFDKEQQENPFSCPCLEDDYGEESFPRE
jgi:hypothetical protein